MNERARATTAPPSYAGVGTAIGAETPAGADVPAEQGVPAEVEAPGAPGARVHSPDAPAPLLEVRGLVVRYGDAVAVDHADLRVPHGGITAILGPSGCGKTSLLRAIAGFGEVAAGEIEIAGHRVVGGGTWVPPERRHVGMVFQEGALFPHLTVSGNVGYGLRGAADAADRVTEVLRLVGLEDLASRFPDELSGGQQQRVALARALAPRPSLVLLDEPFANLDAVLRVHLREEVRRILRDVGATAVLVTHEQEEALSIADVVAVMDGGRMVQVGAPEEIYHRPATAAVAAFVGGGQTLACRVEAGRARTVLGDVAVDAADGPALLLVRPEDLEILPPEAGVGARAVVRRRQFFGHDAIDEVTLAEPDRSLETGTCAAAQAEVDSAAPAGARERGVEVLHVRYLAGSHAVEGDQVRLRLRPKTYTCYRRTG